MQWHWQTTCKNSGHVKNCNMNLVVFQWFCMRFANPVAWPIGRPRLANRRRLAAVIRRDTPSFPKTWGTGIYFRARSVRSAWRRPGRSQRFFRESCRGASSDFKNQQPPEVNEPTRRSRKRWFRGQGRPVAVHTFRVVGREL